MEADFRISSITQRSRPNSARVPVTTQIFRCFILSKPRIGPIHLEQDLHPPASRFLRKSRNLTWYNIGTASASSKHPSDELASPNPDTRFSHFAVQPPVNTEGVSSRAWPRAKHQPESSFHFSINSSLLLLIKPELFC